MWELFESEFLPLLSSQHKTNVLAAYSVLASTLAAGENLIEKVLIIISGYGGNLYIKKFGSTQGGGNKEGGHKGNGGGKNGAAGNNIGYIGNPQRGEVSALFA